MPHNRCSVVKCTKLAGDLVYDSPHSYSMDAVQVTSTRKGLRNQLKTLLWRKQPGALGAAPGRDSPRGSVHGGSVHGGSAAAASANGSAVPYGGGSVEGQMRALADLAFMMQDYDTALSTLRLLASDLRSDKAWKQYAAVQVHCCPFHRLTGRSLVHETALPGREYYHLIPADPAHSGLFFLLLPLPAAKTAPLLCMTRVPCPC